MGGALASLGYTPTAPAAPSAPSPPTGGALASLGYNSTAAPSPSSGGALASLGYTPAQAGGAAYSAGTAPLVSSLPSLSPSETASIGAGVNPTPHPGFFGALARGAEQALVSPVASGIHGLFNGLQRVGNAPLEAQRQGLAAMGLQPQAAPTPQQGKGGGLLGLWGDVSSLLNGGGMAGAPTQSAQEGALLQGAAKAAPAVGQGAANLLALLSQAGNGSGMATAPTNAGQERVAAATLRGLGQGLTEPVTQAPTGADVFAQASGGQAPRMADVALGGADAIATNPASYIPIADVARFLRIPQTAGVIGRGVSSASRALASKSPTAAAALDALRSAGQGVASIFNRFAGLTPEQRASYMRMEGNNMADREQIIAHGQQVFGGNTHLDEPLQAAIERAPGMENELAGTPLEKITTRADRLGVNLPTELANTLGTTGKLPANAAEHIQPLAQAIGQRLGESQAEEQALTQQIKELQETLADPTTPAEKARDAHFDLGEAQNDLAWAKQRSAELQSLQGRVQLPEVKAAPTATPFERVDASATGKPISVKVFHGSGRADANSVYSGGSGIGALLGKAKYYAPTRDVAAKYGPNIAEHAVTLKNPLVLDDDQQWRALTKEAGWDFPNPSGQDKAKTAQDVANLRKLLDAKGYDGVIVRLGTEAKTGTLRDMFDSDQIVAFNPSQAEHNAGAAAQAAARVQELLRNEPAQNPKLQALADQILPKQQATTQELLDRGLIDKARPGYMMHVLNESIENPEGRGIPVNRARPAKASTPAGKPRTVEGSVREINARQTAEHAAKLGIEPGDLFAPSAHASYLTGQLAASRAINMDRMIKELTGKARDVRPERLGEFFENNRNGIAKLPKGQTPINTPAGTSTYTPDTLRFYRAMMLDPRAAELGASIAPEDLHPGFGVSGNVPTYVMPEALANHLNGITSPRVAEDPRLRGLTDAVENLRGKQLRVELSNPTVHAGHNVPWQTFIHDPGALADAGRYLDEVKGAPIPGSDYDQAMRAGAIAHVAPPHLAKQGVADTVVAAMKEAESGKTLGQKASEALHNATFVPERAARVAMFKRAVDRGMTPLQAADMVNGALGNSRMLSPTERGIQRYGLPFYSYEKASLLSNLRQLVNATPRFTIPYGLYNAANVGTSGHNLTNNPQGKTLDLETYGPNGQERFYDPYLPALELAKLGTEGLPTFLGARVSALPFGLALQEFRQASNPLAPPQNEYPIYRYPALEGTPYARANNVPAFGPWGPRIDPRVQLAINALSGPTRYGGVYGGGSPAQVAAQLLGGYTSTKQPGSEAKTAKYNASQVKSELHSARKSGALR